MNGYDSWKLSYPPEWDDPEPSQEQTERAIQYFLDLDLPLEEEKVRDKANALMLEDIEESKRDAEEYQAESRQDDFWDTH